MIQNLRDVDPLLLVDLLGGPFFFRLLLSNMLMISPETDWPEKIVDAVLNGVGKTH